MNSHACCQHYHPSTTGSSRTYLSCHCFVYFTLTQVSLAHNLALSGDPSEPFQFRERASFIEDTLRKTARSF
ncbi:hypothetical protein CY34DRAFT_385116 [Suillus luteus UH-Slu-Lm8-n1]|uniref:Unplaced genomic scaffold CY34scaffold_253, whole genome shotgun sequence n=1 Tax=Suillus luteus UH-Slu-Lm8-n1 TaxID=930992 RepID=A0A0D0B418_9AGAM|nr:hypothetical protein CY34DRAFT_385116 [Suillus luteus UH-Slu-Lm8-n1]